MLLATVTVPPVVTLKAPVPMLKVVPVMAMLPFPMSDNVKLLALLARPPMSVSVPASELKVVAALMVVGSVALLLPVTFSIAAAPPMVVIRVPSDMEPAVGFKRRDPPEMIEILPVPSASLFCISRLPAVIEIFPVMFEFTVAMVSWPPPLLVMPVLPLI